MRILRITALITMAILTTQGIRHFYVRYIEPRTSALDRFDKTDTRTAINEAATLDELVTRYEPTRKKKDALDAELQKGLAPIEDRDAYSLFETKFREAHKTDYQQEQELRGAIGEWEANSIRVLELRAFWIGGAVLLIPGVILLARGFYWLGVSFIIPAVIEMLWWSSPSLSFGGCPKEFNRLLTNKLILTGITFVLIVAFWSWFEVVQKRRSAAGTTRA